jgi:hypothetical protein
MGEIDVGGNLDELTMAEGTSAVQRLAPTTTAVSGPQRILLRTTICQPISCAHRLGNALTTTGSSASSVDLAVLLV